jgi:hypothetical protein
MSEGEARSLRWLLSLGVALPILLFAGLVAWRALVDLETPPPAHDLLFARYGAPGDAPDLIGYEVRNGRLFGTLVVHAPGSGALRPGVPLALYRFRHADQRIEAIDLQRPALPEDPSVAAPTRTTREVALLPALRLSENATAPDGWTFDAGRDRSLGLFGWMFRGDRRSVLTLTRGGARLDIRDDGFGRYDALQFIGWVLDDDGA